MAFNLNKSCFYTAKYLVILVSAFVFILSTPSNSKASQQSGAVLSHNIKFSIDLKAKSIKGIDEIEIDGNSDRLILYVRQNSRIHRITSGKKSLSYKVSASNEQGLKIITVKLPASNDSERRKISILFSGRFQGTDKASGGIKRGVAYLDDGVIDSNGAILPSNANWYPREDGLSAKTTVTIIAPPGFTSVSEGTWAGSVKNERSNADTWRIDHPIDGADVVSSRFNVEKEAYKDIDIYTFFLEKDPQLSRTYIDKTKEYLDLYSGMIGPYPYTKFAIVESTLPTGYGMPSFTLLGSSVIRLPFIPDTSLGHEVAHNWWGNSVFVDDATGNWTEAITTYTADYAFAEKKGVAEAEDFRLMKLVGFRNFASNEGALKDFRHSTEAGGRAVGYNKGFFLFVMLRSALGERDFNAALKRFYSENKFKKATWRDIQRAFEEVSGQKLGRFFDQWLDQAGGPAISLLKASAAQNEKTGYTLRYTIGQNTGRYTLQVPVAITLKEGATSDAEKIIETTVISDAAAKDFEMQLDAQPISIELDPRSTVFRILDDAEVPPTLSGFLSDDKGIIVVPDATDPAYAEAIKAIQKDYPKEVAAFSDARLDELINASSALVIVPARSPDDTTGAASRLIKRFTDNNSGPPAYEKKLLFNDDAQTITCRKNPYNPSKTICLLTIEGSPEIMLDTTRRLRYFGDWSHLIFSNKKVLEKTRFKGHKILYKPL